MLRQDDGKLHTGHVDVRLVDIVDEAWAEDTLPKDGELFDALR